MTKISNNFLIGTVNKDLDERLVPMGQLTDAMNISIITSEEGQKGVVKNALGNVKKTNIAVDFGIVNPITIHTAKSSFDGKIYNFVCGDNYDAIIEYNSVNSSTVRVLQSVHGGALNFSKTNKIKASDIIVTSEGEGNFLAWTGDLNPPRIINIDRAKLYGLNDFASTEISVMKPSPITAPDLLLTIITGTSNDFIKDKFLEFSYRYKYNDGYYSALSSWSEVAFMPKTFKMDYQSYENNGMLNLFNAVDISFNTGPRDVIGIDIVFKESNSDTAYIIDKFVKADEGWDGVNNNSIKTIQFSKSKVYSVLPDAQYSRNFDNVPLLANAQTTIGSRLLYGDFTEGRDITEKIDYTVGFVSLPLYSDAVEHSIEDNNGIVAYSNLVDFEEGHKVSGADISSAIINYLSNEIYFSSNDATHKTRITITVTPQAGYNSSLYDLKVSNSTAIIYEYNNISGVQTKTFDITDNSLIKIYVCKGDGLIYDLKLTYDLLYSSSGSDPWGSVSKYEYNALYQLSFINPTPSTLYETGTKIIDTLCKYDFTGFDFKKGQQLIFNFELKSSLVDFDSSSTYAYTLVSDYTDLANFISTSDLKHQIEDVFSVSFMTDSVFVSNEGVINVAGSIGFKVSYSGNYLYITTPIVKYSVTEPSGTVQDKYEFFIVNIINLVVASNSAYRSMHSNRDYEVCLIYLDGEGRKTTALVSADNSVNIGNENSDTVNLLSININNQPPSWAKKYKFGIKQTTGNYEIIYANVIYKDGVYRWIKLEGENINKVKEGSILVVKSDLSGFRNDINPIKVKVLEISEKASDFIPGNILDSGDDLIEKSGKYIKIKQGAFDLSIDKDSIKSFVGSAGGRYPASNNWKISTDPGFGEVSGTIYTPYEVNVGTSITIDIKIKAFGAIAFEHEFVLDTVSTDNYPSFRDWFYSEVEGLDTWDKFKANDPSNGGYLKDWGFITKTVNSVSCADYEFYVTPWRDGTSTRDVYTDIAIDVNFSRGTLIFETEPDTDLGKLYFETPETFNIVSNTHQSNPHVLTRAFNCFTFGNGVESYQIQDGFNRKYLRMSNNPTAVTQDIYKQINRFADLTYSEVFQESTNINRLNEFNLYLANYKDDMQKSFGKIVSIKGFDTNLDVIQEDKYSVVYYGKDLLYNADGSTNLQKIPEVLGQQKAIDGEFGSQHPGAFDFYGFNRFFPDVKRCVVMQKSNEGLVPISNYGMNFDFTRLFADNTIDDVVAAYDLYLNVYIINVKYTDKNSAKQYVTWLYSDESNGWVTKQSFNPEDMTRLNGGFYSCYLGEIYKHNESQNYNTFYGTQTASSFSFNMNIEPGTRKVFRTLSTEGTDTWKAKTITDQQKGHIDISDYQIKEGVSYAYIRGDEDSSTQNVDTATPSTQGIGTVYSISGNNVLINGSISNMVSVGDKVFKANGTLIGNITAILSNGITLSSVVGLAGGDFVYSTKPQSVETSGLLGYYMNVTLELNKNTRSELYQVNSEVSKSFM